MAGTSGSGYSDATSGPVATTIVEPNVILTLATEFSNRCLEFWSEIDSNPANTLAVLERER